MPTAHSEHSLPTSVPYPAAHKLHWSAAVLPLLAVVVLVGQPTHAAVVSPTPYVPFAQMVHEPLAQLPYPSEHRLHSLTSAEPTSTVVVPVTQDEHAPVPPPAEY